MAVWSHVNLSALELTRFDAEFYRPEYLAAQARVGDKKLKSYGVTVLHPAEFLREYGDSGLFILLAQNNRDNFYDWSTARYASTNLSDLLTRNRLEFGDVTITRSGANFGQTSVIGFELEENVIYACADLLVLRSNSIDGYVISTYLNTKVGRLLLDRGAYGAAQPHLAPTYIKEISFPERLTQCQEEISTFVKKSRSLSKKAEGAYNQAQQLVEAEMGLDKLRFKKPVGYTAQLSELELSRRFDSERFYPAFANWVSRLPRNIKLVPLASLLTFCQRGKQPIYTEQGLPVINSKHVQPNKIVLEGNRSAQASPVADYQIRCGDTLINGTGRGTIGRAAPYLIADHQAIPDNHVTILRTSSLDPAYLSFYLNSQAGQLQVERHQRGSSGQLELYPFDIRKFLVWEAPETVQREIRRLHDQATESAQRSRQLLEQAKSRVEQLIEEAVQS